MYNRGIALSNIHNYLTSFQDHIRRLNAVGKFDINKEAETIALSLLNLVYDYDLANTNKKIQENFPAIDLFDDSKGIAVQVTSDASFTKIETTLDKFIEHNLFGQYPSLFIFVLLDKQSRYNKASHETIANKTNKYFKFDIDRNVFDTLTLSKDIEALPTEKVLEVERLLAIEFGEGQPKIPLMKFTNSRQSRFKLNFSERTTSFRGRIDELSALTRFFNEDGLFSWWIVSGKAGTGKSRLALEFGALLESTGVAWGFVRPQDIETLNGDQFGYRPTLLILDNALTQEEAIRQLIIRLAGQQTRHKLRVLLLEREVSGDWWNRFLNSLPIASSVFNEVPLHLSGLGNEILIQIIREVILSESPEFDLSSVDLVDVVNQVDALKRPVFIILAGIAIANGSDILAWNEYNLLDFYLQYNDERVRETFRGVTKLSLYKHKNLLALASATGDLINFNAKLLFEKNISWLPTKSEFDDELYTFLSDHSSVEPSRPLAFNESHAHQFEVRYANEDDNKVLAYGLTPDILGEYYVLKNLSEHTFSMLDIEKREQFCGVATAASIYNYSYFLRRTLQDYPMHASVGLLFRGVKDSLFDTRGSYGKLVLDAMQMLYTGSLTVLERLLRLTKNLAESTEFTSSQKKFMDYPERVYQDACRILVYNLAGNYPAQKKYYQIMQQNTAQFEQQPQELIDSSFNPFEDFDISEKFEELQKMSDPGYAEAYLSKRTVTDQRIPHLEALAIDCMLRDGNVQSNATVAEPLVDRLFTLAETFSDPRIKSLLGWTLLNSPSLLNETVISRIERLHRAILDTPPQVMPIDIGMEQFHFTRHLVAYFQQAGKDERVWFYYHEFLKHCFSQVPNRRYIPVFINAATLALNLIHHYVECGNKVLAIWYYNEIVAINNLFVSLADNPVAHLFIEARSIISRL